MSLENVFGNHQQLALSPLAGPKYPKGELRARMHFINCHGGEASPIFQGQKGEKRPVYPESLTTATTGATISDGTVAAIECCYGAQLYDSVKLGIDMPICQSYLRQGAYGYFGSTTIAYGPADDNSAADLVCQYFLLSLLDGASVGRAALVARQQFVERTGQMDPIDLKTLAQFCRPGRSQRASGGHPQGAGHPQGRRRRQVATLLPRRTARQAQAEWRVPGEDQAHRVQKGAAAEAPGGGRPVAVPHRPGRRPVGRAKIRAFRG